MWLQAPAGQDTRNKAQPRMVRQHTKGVVSCAHQSRVCLQPCAPCHTLWEPDNVSHCSTAHLQHRGNTTPQLCGTRGRTADANAWQLHTHQSCLPGRACCRCHLVAPHTCPAAERHQGAPGRVAAQSRHPASCCCAASHPLQHLSAQSGWETQTLYTGRHRYTHSEFMHASRAAPQKAHQRQAASNHITK